MAKCSARQLIPCAQVLYNTPAPGLAIGAQVLGGATFNHLPNQGASDIRWMTAGVGATLFIQGQFPWQAPPWIPPQPREPNGLEP